MGWLGSSAALAILSFDVDAESAILAEGRQYAGHPSAMSHQRYGPLVGVPVGIPPRNGLPGGNAVREPVCAASGRGTRSRHEPNTNDRRLVLVVTDRQASATTAQPGRPRNFSLRSSLLPRRLWLHELAQRTDAQARACGEPQ